jgi:hypothetical protein
VTFSLVAVDLDLEAKVPAASRAGRPASGRSGWRRRRSPACRDDEAGLFGFDDGEDLGDGERLNRHVGLTRMPRSAPMASAVRMVSCACAGPIDTTTISVPTPFSFRRTASSTAISSERVHRHLDVGEIDARAEAMAAKRDETVEYFVAGFRQMLEGNMDAYAKNFDSYMKPQG